MIRQILREKAALLGDKPFLCFRDESISFREMDERSNRAANLLREIGVRRGDKVCLMIGNRPEFVELWFGLAKLGAIMVPMEISLGRKSASYIASHSDATVFAVEDSAYLAIEEWLRKLPKIRKKIWIGSIGGGPHGFLNFRETVGAFPRTAGRLPPTDPSDVMSIVYTPGTTGLPKGAMISHRNYSHAGSLWAEHVVRADARDVFYTTQHLSLVQTQTLSVVGALVSGCRLVLGDGFIARTFFDAIRRHGATVFPYTSSMIESLMKLEPRPDDAANPARLAFGGAADRSMAREFGDRFGIEMVEGFQLAECGGMCLANFGEGAKEGAIGRPLPSYEVKVFDEFQEELPTGLSGEIVLRPTTPESAFLGYYREPDRTAENMANGWFHTGDRGYVDTEGYFFFIDRKGDCIRRGREVFPCVEVERIVNGHPNVLESAATGILSELDDEDVRVFLVLHPGMDVTPEEFVAWCSGRMPSHLVPRYVEIVRELPKTAIGGIRKHELRKRPVRGDGRQDRRRAVTPANSPFEQ
ncbi:MAG: AMP-binding protein [Desulfobacteria bacterium]|nr:AMP-binding protein [Deltaproteobacteria bacterium]